MLQRIRRLVPGQRALHIAATVWLMATSSAQAQEQAFIATVGTTLSAKSTRSLAAVAGCPDQGGLLDSVSVPVGQPLDLRVQIGRPAPRGGASFELRSDDPSVVAAGDRRQAFFPRVFIPEGQFVSNPFSIFGIKVGGTRLRLIALTAGFGSGSFPLGAWDLNKGGEERFVDANSPSRTCRASDSSNELSTDPNRLSTCGVAAKGIASDALSQLLLRSVSGLPGTMCYEITSTSTFDQGRIQSPLLSTQRVGNRDYGFSFYKAPENFGDTANFRDVEFEFTFTPSIGNGNTTRFRAKTTIVRPPVILVHGIWSGAGTWDWTGGFTKENAHRTTFAGDYAATNGARFSTNSPLIQGFVSNGLKATRDKGFAVTQADVMGHSMGGILTRLYVDGSQFKRPDNFGKGDVRRLISIDTPHSGSTFPSLVAGLHQVKPAQTVAAVRSITGFAPQGGALCDLAENSPALAGLNSATTIKAQAITGTGGPAGTNANPARFFGGFLSFGNIEGELTKKVCTRRGGVLDLFRCLQEEFVFPQVVVDAFRFRQANDTIVSLVSQQGGSCGSAGLAGINFANVIHAGDWGAGGVLNSSDVADRAYQLLDGPNSGFANSFPGVGSTSLGAACTVPGRGAVLDAQDYASQCSAGGPLNAPTASSQQLQALQSANKRSLALNVAADDRVQIVSPAPGQVFAPGETISITVRLGAGLLANNISVTIPGISTLPGTEYDGNTFKASFAIPNFFVGPLALTPNITDTNNTAIEGPAVTVAVRSVVAPTTIGFQQRNYRLGPQAIGRPEQLFVFGNYPGDIRRNIKSSAAGTSYVSSNPGVVSVNAEGIFLVNDKGIAIVTASNSGRQDFAAFVVEDSSNPLPPTEYTAQMSIQQSGLRLDRSTGFFVQSIDVVNTQTVPIPGPLYLVLAGLPAGVNLVSQSGITETVRIGSPYLSIPLLSDGLTLLPGQRVTFNAQFLNPTRVNFSYAASVWRASTGP